MSGHVSEVLRAVLLDPWGGFGFGRDDDDVLGLVVVVVVLVDVHERDYLRHDELGLMPNA